jgi:hypothetical protein
MKPMSLVTPEAIAQEYGGNKKKIAEAARLGLVDPTAAVMAGMFIDQMRAAAAAEQTQNTTVAQDVFGLDSLQTPAAPTAPPAQAAPAQGLPAAQMAMAPQGQPMMPNSGVEALPTGDVGNYAGGGIVAFAGDEGSLVTEDEIRRMTPPHEYVPGRGLSNPELFTVPMGTDMEQRQIFDSFSMGATDPRDRLAAQLRSSPSEIDKLLKTLTPSMDVPSRTGKSRNRLIDPEFRTSDPAKIAKAKLDILQGELANQKQALAIAKAPDEKARAEANIKEIQREISIALKSTKAAPRAEPTDSGVLAIKQLSPDSPQAQALRTQRETRLGGNLPPSPLNLPAIDTSPQQAMNVGKVIAEGMYPESEMPKPKAMKDYLAQQKELMAEAGVDPDFFKKQAESLAEERRQGKLDKEEAKNMRILEAGLRIMSGTSPFAMVNIGTGGSEAMKGLAEDIKEMRKNEKDLKKAERELAFSEQKYNLDLTTASQNRYDKAQARYDALRDNKVKLQSDIGKAVMSSTTQKDVAGIYTGSAEKVAEMREKSLPDIMKAVDSPQMKNAMPGASFLDRLEAYARATQPKDVQNAIINATTQAKKQAAEEFQMALTYNSKLREDWTKAQQGDKDAQRRVDDARTAIEKRAMQGIPNLPGPTTGPRPELSPQDREALNWANSHPSDPRAAQIKARLGVQ